MVDYIAKIKTPDGETRTIGGDIFDGQWVYVSVILNKGSGFEAGASKVIDLSSYIPDDGCDYEVRVSGYIHTGATSGNAAGFFVNQGSSYTAQYIRLCRAVTRTASHETCAGNATIPLLYPNRTINLRNADASGKSGNYSFNINGYRRLGKSNELTDNYIQNIQTRKHKLQVGGDMLNAQPVIKNMNIMSKVSISASGGRYTYDLSSYLPNDGYDYLVTCNVTASGDSTNGHYISLRCRSNLSGDTFFTFINEQINRGAASRGFKESFEIIVRGSSRKLIFENTGSSACTTSVNIKTYRRIGKNGAEDKEYISNINNIPFGGNICDGRWTYNSRALYSGLTVTANTSKVYDISTYLPDDGYIYEVLLWGYCRTGAKSGNAVAQYVYSGKDSSLVGKQLTWQVTRSSSSNAAGGNTSLIIYPQNKNIYSVLNVSGSTTGANGLYLVAYRRIGINHY